MRNVSAKSIRRIFMAGVAAAALLALAVAGSSVFGGKTGFDGKAYAQGQGQGGGGQGRGKGGRGGSASGQSGSGEEGHSGSGEEGHSGSGEDEGEGKKGPKYMGGRSGSTEAGHGGSGEEGHSSSGEDEGEGKGSQGKGGGSGQKPTADSQGGKPVWAQEGIPEVELGRLSVVRAPSQVIQKAEAEAIASFDPTKSAALYSMTAEAFAAHVKANYDTVVRIDSPLENLGLYKDFLVESKTALPGVTPASKLDLAAIFLGSASDKTIAVTADTVTAVTKILGLPDFTAAETAALAAKADAVRAAIEEGHG